MAVKSGLVKGNKWDGTGLMMVPLETGTDRVLIQKDTEASILNNLTDSSNNKSSAISNQYRDKKSMMIGADNNTKEIITHLRFKLVI